MGTYNKGILGAFSGKVGPVVGATWRGKDVMRSLPKKSNRLATAFQQQQRSKFAMVFFWFFCVFLVLFWGCILEVF